MSDEFMMRIQLQKVVAYRELCRAVRRSGRENVFFAFLMLVVFYGPWIANGRWLNYLILGILVGSEILVGLFKWFFPSAEGFLLDALVLLVFAAYNLGMSFLQFQAGQKPSPIWILISVYMLFGAINRFKHYRQIRRLFADRPSAEHIAWFDELVHEIRTADPQIDDQVIDLPTGPHWKAKLLGRMAFFIALRENTVWIVGPADFDVVLSPRNEEMDTHKAFLRLFDRSYPSFEISTATWQNYQKWRDALESAV